MVGICLTLVKVETGFCGRGTLANRKMLAVHLQIEEPSAPMSPVLIMHFLVFAISNTTSSPKAFSRDDIISGYY